MYERERCIAPKSTKMINRYEKFTFFIEEVGKLLHKISSDEMEQLGLKGSYALYLLMISDAEDGITSSEISEKCGRDKADVSRAVNMMISKGFVTKRTSGTNYRAPITLTDSGRAAVERLRKTARNAVVYASHNVSDENLCCFYDTLETIYKNLSTMSKTGVPTAGEQSD